MDTTPLSQTVATEHTVNGRQFVNIDVFLACYPKASKEAKRQIKREMKIANGDVGKRVESIFRENLMEWCMKLHPGQMALYAPIVLRDGFVIWTSSGHDQLIAALSQLFVEGHNESVSRVEFLYGGYGWYISTVQPKTISLGTTYQPSSADQNIFSRFDLQYYEK